MPLNRENITQNALIPAVLRRGTETLKSQEEISIELEKYVWSNIRLWR